MASTIVSHWPDTVFAWALILKVIMRGLITRASPIYRFVKIVSSYFLFNPFMKFVAFEKSRSTATSATTLTVKYLWLGIISVESVDKC